MSIQLGLTTPRYAEQPSATVGADMCLQAHQDEGSSCCSTAFKVAAVIAGIIASIGSFFLMGPIGGLVVTALAGAGLLCLFSCCSEGSAPDHLPNNVAIPWYQRVFSFIPIPVRNDPHVRVGGGHFAAPRPWYQQWFPFMHSGTRH